MVGLIQVDRRPFGIDKYTSQPVLHYFGRNLNRTIHCGNAEDGRRNNAYSAARFELSIKPSQHIAILRES